MAENKVYYWLKFQKDFFRSLRIKRLRKLAGGDTFTIIYLKLQLLSLSTSGYLEYKGVFETFEEEMAEEIDEDSENIAITVQYLISCGLMEQKENQYFLPYVPLNTGSETSSAARVRKHRENQKALHCNTDVTKCNTDFVTCNTEREKEIEKEKDIEIEREKEHNAHSSSGIPCGNQAVYQSVTQKRIEENREEENREETATALEFNFNSEKAWDDTFKLYPKKRNAFSAKVEWCNILRPIIPQNQKDIAKLIYYGLKMYLDDYQKNNADDESFKFIPTFDKWLREDSMYWMKEYERLHKGDDA